MTASRPISTSATPAENNGRPVSAPQTVVTTASAARCNISATGGRRSDDRVTAIASTTKEHATMATAIVKPSSTSHIPARYLKQETQNCVGNRRGQQTQQFEAERQTEGKRDFYTAPVQALLDKRGGLFGAPHERLVTRKNVAHRGSHETGHHH